MNKEITLEDLALMVKEEFDETQKQIKQFRGENQREHKILHQKLEDIELRLGNVAYRFEFDELEKRIGVLEQKLFTA